MIFKILGYNNGWCRSITYNNGMMIDAHAPSKIVLQAMEDGDVDVELILNKGGMDNAICTVNSTKINVGDRLNVKLNKNNILTLKCDANDKTRCWYDWCLSNSKTIPNLSEKAYQFDKHNKLGDSISMLVGFENYAIQNNIEIINISGPKLYLDVMDLFKFNRINYVGVNGGKIIDDIFMQGKWNVNWLQRFGYAFSSVYGGKFDGNIIMPEILVKTKRSNNGKVLCQLDSRSSGMLDNKQINDILSNHENVEVIGGPDTSNYLGDDYIYNTGNVLYIANELLKCNYVIAGDSGVAHLAGMLGIKCLVYPGPHIDYDNVKCFFSCYNSIEVIQTKNIVNSVQSSISTNLIGKKCLINNLIYTINSVVAFDDDITIFADNNESIIKAKYDKVRLL